MKRGNHVAGIIVLLASLCGCTHETPSQQPIANPTPAAFSLRTDGVIDIGDAFAEINYYDSNWTIAQQHDRFELTNPIPKPVLPADVHVIHGVLNTAGGLANIRERVEMRSADEIYYSAEFTSAKPLDTNELSIAFLLPLSSFGGKQAMFDQTTVPLPSIAPKKGDAKIFAQDGIRKVELATPKGNLIVTGNFKVLLQDDREWGDPRYSLRLLWTPGSGKSPESNQLADEDDSDGAVTPATSTDLISGTVR